MNTTNEIIWEMFHKGGISKIKAESAWVDNQPCKVLVTHHGDLVNRVTCYKWHKNMKKCETCMYGVN